MDKYSGFEDLPAEVAERLKRQIISGKRVCTQISKDATPQEISDAFLEDTKNPDYNYKQLAQIVDAFTLFNNAVGRGLPNQLYQMLAQTLDSDIAKVAYAAHIIWYAHEGSKSAKEALREFTNLVKAEIDKRAGWTEEQFDKEYFLRNQDH